MFDQLEFNGRKKKNPLLSFSPCFSGQGYSRLTENYRLLSFIHSFQLKTALGDPGISPRNLDPNPTRKYVENEENPSNGEEKLEAGGRFVAEMKYLRVRDGVVGSKCERFFPAKSFLSRSLSCCLRGVGKSRY